MQDGKGREFRFFYEKLWNDPVAAIILGALGTMCGRYEYWQREYAIGWSQGWNRRALFHHWRDVLRALRRDCVNINFGGIFSILPPELERPNLTVNAYDLAARPPAPLLIDGEDKGPRYWERKCVWRNNVGTPAGAELVIDIDLDDQKPDTQYNRQGICDCAGAKRSACHVCWNTFMNPAQAAMEVILAHLGIQHWFAVFSGRRGLHYWLLDDWILRMTNGERTAFMEILAKPPTFHSDLGRALLDVLAPYFDATPVLVSRGATLPKYDAIMRELYPRLDVPVGADASHLHGVPLTLHPETRCLRIPLESVRDEATRFCFKTHQWNVDRLTCENPNLLLAFALRILRRLPRNSGLDARDYLSQLLKEGGLPFSKSETFK